MISLNGILCTNIVEGSFDSAKFKQFIDGLLNLMNQYPAPRSVIIMDNCAIHKSSDVLDMIIERFVRTSIWDYLTLIQVSTGRGMRYEFLPPYSPDYNPIEPAFSKIKKFIQRNGDLSRAASDERPNLHIKLALVEAVNSVTAMDAEGWYRLSAYL